VALKLIKPGMDSRQVLSRFEAERQALAMMDHPNIAKVLDGGATDQGRPFFVMEYVKGVPITDFCDHARLTVHERLKLFVQVCQAVQHAHQKGIIHRDLKPANILVCLYDGVPVPKVIDFGLAKAMHQPLTERTLYTAHGLMVGTPLYMSPEQAEFNNLDIDTRSDVYSLGVLLYELLTGAPPLDAARLKVATWHEILRLIKEEEPPPPSSRLSRGDMLARVAVARRLEPAQLRRAVRGDLDRIVMKRGERTARGARRPATWHATSSGTCDTSRSRRGPSAIYRFASSRAQSRGIDDGVLVFGVGRRHHREHRAGHSRHARRAGGRGGAGREARHRKIAEDQRSQTDAAREAQLRARPKNDAPGRG
jgi:serine/threonine protein kinase